MRESRETDEVLVCVAQRLQGQLERQLTLVERLQDPSRDDEALVDLAEIRTSLLRSLRGSENLLVLGGAQQSPGFRGPRSVADVLTDARAGVEDASRIGLGTAPAAVVAPRAVTGLVALITELFTHGLTLSPGPARVEVVSRRTDDGGVSVEIGTDGPGPSTSELDELNRRLADRPIVDDIVSNRVGLFVAARLAQRCGAILRVHQRRAGALPAHGLVTVVHCPPDLLDAVEFAAPDTPRAWNRAPSENGNGHHDNGRPGNGHPGPPQPSQRAARRPDPLLDPLPPPPVAPPPPPVTRPPAVPALPLRNPEPALWAEPPPRGTGPDELFGPLTSSLNRMRDSGPTPIYESVASAWFVGADATDAPAQGAPPADWTTPSDAEWRAASERAARPGPEQSSTAAGLPRRSPGTQMVAPSRHGAPAPLSGSTEREPERVRERLAVYQQGLERGRHRATDDEL